MRHQSLLVWKSLCMGSILRVTSMYLGRQEAGTVELVWVVNVSLPPATLI